MDVKIAQIADDIKFHKRQTIHDILCLKLKEEMVGHVKSILIVDDNKRVRDSLKSLLELENDFAVVGEAKSGKEAIKQTAFLRPDIVLMDLSMPDINGLQAARRIKRKNPRIRVAILSVYDYQQNYRYAEKADISVWIAKSSSPEDIIHTLRAVVD